MVGPKAAKPNPVKSQFPTMKQAKSPLPQSHSRL